MFFPELAAAMDIRHYGELARIVQKIESCNFAHDFKQLYDDARAMMQSLERLQDLQKAIIQMDQKKMLEIKNYTNPPRLVHEVMIATLLLLGEPESNTRVSRLWDDQSVERSVGK